MAQSAAPRFSIGRVIAESFGIYARNFISCSVLALLIGLIDLLITIFYLAPNQVGGVGFDAVLMISLMLLTHTLTQATIVFGTFQDLRGHKAGIGTCIAHGLSSIIPVIVGSIILVIGTGLASLLLLIPGLIVMTMWWVYIPTIVVERKSMAAGFVRSQELTSGHRWPIFGLIIIVMVLSAIVTYVSRTTSFTVISNSTSMDAFCNLRLRLSRFLLGCCIRGSGSGRRLLLFARREGRHRRGRHCERVRLTFAAAPISVH